MKMKYPNIDRKREEKKLSKADISKIMGISLKTYYNWINGKTDIPSSKLIKLSKILNESIDFLLMG